MTDLASDGNGVPVYNRWEYIWTCLIPGMPQKVQLPEVVVVDASPGEGTQDVLAPYLEVIYVRSWHFRVQDSLCKRPWTATPVERRSTSVPSWTPKLDCSFHQYVWTGRGRGPGFSGRSLGDAGLPLRALPATIPRSQAESTSRARTIAMWH